VRIGINALAVSPQRPGGDVTYVIELVRRLPALAPTTNWFVFATRAAIDLIGRLDSNARYVECAVPGTSVPVRALWEQTALVARVNRARLDVLHAPINVSPVAYHAPTVLTLHEAEPFMPGASIPSPLLAWWRVTRTLSARYAARKLTVSEAARLELVRWMGLRPEQLDVVHLGVDLTRFSLSAGNMPAPLAGEPYLLWVGRPYPSKNLGTLLGAFSELRKAGRPERLVLIGPPGWEEPALLDRIASEFPDGSILRLPAVWSDLPRWYAHASVFAFPSIRETFGLPVLESMASGTPVVASDIAALREVGGKAALYVAPRGVTDLATAVGRLLDSPSDADELRQAGLARAATFDWAATAQKTLMVLHAAT
jgi:glycosyltransferase involved in cell wall biosynthesis